MSLEKHPSWLAPAAVGGVLLALFAGMVVRGETLAFRDAAHFYYPLFEYCRDEWGAGRVPLWNPYLNLGQPLAADTVSSVFYPVKLVFALPLPYAPLYTGYILLHVLLAAWGAFRLTRRAGASRAAAGLAALGYAFGGHVLASVYNVVFLVGAAWLPIALWAADAMLTGRSWRAAVAFGLTLAMMVLGGDPQTAYHAGLLAVGYAVLLTRSEDRTLSSALREALRRLVRRSPSDNASPGPSRFGLLLLAAMVAFAAAAVQVVPAWELARHSTRAEAPLVDRLIGIAPPDSHLEQAYHFSVGPWRWAEFVWPNVAGQQWPVQRRWFDAIPAEGRVWTPSLYVGLVPLAFALMAFRLRRGDVRVRLASWAVLFGLLGGMGWFGLGWLLRETGIARLPVGEPFGGLYWLMNLVLPVYAQFRYPAKLLVVASLGLTLLAARGFDAQLAEPSRGLQRVLACLAAISLALLLAWLAEDVWRACLARAPANVLFGPFDVDGAWRVTAGALAQTCIVAIVLVWLLRRTAAPWVGMAVVALAAVDLAVAQRGLIIGTSPVAWESTSPLAEAARQAQQDVLPAPPRIVYAEPFHPPRWRQTSSPSRLTETTTVDRLLLRPRFNLLDRIGVVELDEAVVLADFAAAANGAVQRFAPHATIIDTRDTVPPVVRLEPNAEAFARVWLDGDPSGSCRIVAYEPSRLVVEADVTRPSTLVLAEQFYPGWSADAATDGQPARRVPIVRAHDVMRGVTLPAGRHTLVFRYRPTGFYVGAAISVCAWCVMAGYAAFRWRRRGSAGLRPMQNGGC
jgi:hypothetical protein